jgi:TonB-dependent starch-binding outer membrane protein SusC
LKSKIIFSVYLILCCSYISSGQKKITISGKVTDAKHSPVEGAVIFIDKVKTNSVTDQQGYYKVKVNPAAKEILVFTLLYGASEELISGRTSIDFILSGNSSEKKTKDTIGAGKSDNISNGASDKKNVPPQFGVIDAQKTEFAGYQNIYEMIRGRIPGVQVTGNSIKVMGSSSLNISTEPIFVVDGVIVNGIDDISPQDVKSIEVLKGPAASVYGMRGANGVIVITRLSGKDTKTDVR